MAEALPPQPVKLLVGMIAGRPDWLDAAVEMLAADHGQADIVSPDMPFDFTDYYADQMGENLLRRFVSFGRLVSPGDLASIKRRTNALESELANRFAGPSRPVNLDPGYVEPGKLVLASAKNFAHRIFLADGIYAEVTLRYRHGRWESWPWTFPDYASGRYDAFLEAVRTELKRQLHEGDERT